MIRRFCLLSSVCMHYSVHDANLLFIEVYVDTEYYPVYIAALLISYYNYVITNLQLCNN